MLPYYLIISRSLTHAQRTASVLERAGIHAPVQRAPKLVAEEGCSHAVRVTEHQLSKALSVLARAEMTPTRVLLYDPQGEYREVGF